MSRRDFLVVQGSKYSPEEFVDPYDIPFDAPNQCVPILPQIPNRQRTFIATQNQLRSMSNNTGQRTRTQEDGSFTVNPEPVPFQPQNFMHNVTNSKSHQESSTSLKKVPLAKRHLDSFGGYEYTMGAKRGLILHTDRYQWDGPRVWEGMSQRDRLRAEIEYMEKLRGVKRRREMLPHRAQIDLLMGGKKIDFVERFDIQKEIAKLKSLIMPTHARDLFHGRGFLLPENHMSIKPRKPPILDYDSDEDIAPPSATLQRHDKSRFDSDFGISKTKYGGSSRRSYEGQLPRINTRSTTLGTSAVYLKRSRTNIQSKYEKRVNRSLTSFPHQKEQSLKVTVDNESVKRVDLASGHQSSKSVPVQPAKPAPEPDVDPPNTELGSEIRTLNQDLDEDLGIVDDNTDRNTLVSRGSKVASPVKSVTPNPLKGSELPSMISENERDELKEKFKKLDTDSDGHLMYSQVQTQIPKELSNQQERFLKQVYDITSSSTFFGVDEFMTMSALTKTVLNLSESAADAFRELNFAEIHDNITNFVQLFQSHDRSGRGKVTLDAFKDVLTQALELDISSSLWNKILDTLSPSEEIQITKIEFLSHIPYFLSLKKT